MLVDVLLPPVLVLVATVVVGRSTTLDPRPLGAATFWLFSPCLVLDALATGDVALGTLARFVVLPLGVAFAVWGVGELLMRALRLPAESRDALVLGAVLMNAGNLGLPIVGFRYGELGATVGAVVFVGSAVVSATIGVWIASRGASASPWRLFRVPLVWAAVLGLVLRQSEVELPLAVGRAVGLLGQAAIPCMLVVLGLQLQGVTAGRPGGLKWRGIVAAALLKLVLAPALALALGAALGLSGPSLGVAVLQHAMPTAVFTMVLVTEYQRAPETAAFVVVALTALAGLTVPLWVIGLAGL